jgi:hypothetical protein
MIALGHSLRKFEASVGCNYQPPAEETHNTTKRGIIFVIFSYASPMVKPEDQVEDHPLL